MTKLKPYGGKIKPAEFCKPLWQAKQSLKWKCDKEGEEITLSQTRMPGTSGSQQHGALSANTMTPKKERYKKACKKKKRAKEHQGCTKQACLRTPREDGAEFSTKTPKQENLTEWKRGKTKDVPIKRDWDTQGNGGAKEAPGPQVFHLGQQLRIQ